MASEMSEEMISPTKANPTSSSLTDPSPTKISPSKEIHKYRPIFTGHDEDGQAQEASTVKSTKKRPMTSSRLLELSDLLDITPSIAKSIELELRTSQADEKSFQAVEDQFQKMRNQKSIVENMASLESLMNTFIVERDAINGHYLSFKMTLLLESTPEDSIDHFFTTKPISSERIYREYIGDLSYDTLSKAIYGSEGHLTVEGDAMVEGYSMVPNGTNSMDVEPSNGTEHNTNTNQKPSSSRKEEVDKSRLQLELALEEYLEPELTDKNLRSMIKERQKELSVRAYKNRQRPADLGPPKYFGTVVDPKSAEANAKGPAPSFSMFFDRPNLPVLLRQPASKKRRLLIQGCVPAVEYTFADTSVNEYGDLLTSEGSGTTASNGSDSGGKWRGRTELERRWLIIEKREIHKAAKICSNNHHVIRENAKMLAEAVQKEVMKRISNVKTLASQNVQHARLLSKNLNVYIRKNEKDWRKRAEKEAEVVRRVEEEAKDKEQAAKKLNFLLTQTELYSHFMAKKLGIKAAEAEVASMDPTKEPDVLPPESAFHDANAQDTHKAREEALKAFKDHRSKIDKFDDESTKLRGASRAQQQSQSQQSQSQTQQQQPSVSSGSSIATLPTGHRKTGGLVTTNMPIASTNTGEVGSGMIEQPRRLVGTLKPYQVKGLNWLYNLYEQGINGILADEMGLGKTVQTISLLAHLAETRGIWGPFIVIAPTSTLPNWANEIAKFCPHFKVLPYWGNVKQRSALRKLLNPRYLHRPDSVVHVVVTSYNLIIHDEKFFHRIHWEYMILDEAHAIKSSTSVRWNTLLSFGNCRSRLLLTGTPIQNNMAELWALLHFIMPTLFDSHNEFYEWFSKDIEEHAQGAKSGLNEHQLNRLHLILKPFMLRRVKGDVENEMPPKYEVEIRCDMTSRQAALYTGIKNKISVGELLNKMNVPLGKLAQEKQAKHLMNIVMQFRNVCNHPEILERSETWSPMQFSPMAPPTLSYGNIISSANKNHIELTIPRLIYREALLNLSLEHSGMTPEQGTRAKWLFNRFNIFSQLNIHSSIFARPFEVGDRIQVLSSNQISENNGSQPTNNGSQSAANITVGSTSTKLNIRGLSKAVVKKKEPVRNKELLALEADVPDRNHCWDFIRLADLSPSEVEWIHQQDSWRRWEAILGSHQRDIQLSFSTQAVDDDVSANNMDLDEVSPVYFRPLQNTSNLLKIVSVESPVGLPSTSSSPIIADLVTDDPIRRSNLDRKAITATRDATRKRVWAAPPSIYCNHRRFVSHRDAFLNNNGVWKLLLGYSRSQNSPEELISPVSTVRLVKPSIPMALPLLSVCGSSAIRVPQFSELVRDSGKLKVLDGLLKTLKREGHRVLVYSQFTEVLDLLEDFLYVRSHKFVRLDGSSKLDDRRDMVDMYQNDPSLFVFLLSTRAGGLGINLTAADTVIFYDSDWNPTMDAQAMDRAHRLGQTRPVTVYRLVTRNSVEERILLRAKQKGTIQNLVIQGGHFNMSSEEAEDIFKPSEVMDLLMDDSELDAIAKSNSSSKKRGLINPIKMGMKPRSAKPTKPSAKPSTGPLAVNMVDEVITTSTTSTETPKPAGLPSKSVNNSANNSPSKPAPTVPVQEPMEE